MSAAAAVVSSPAQNALHGYNIIKRRTGDTTMAQPLNHGLIATTADTIDLSVSSLLNLCVIKCHSTFLLDNGGEKEMFACGFKVWFVSFWV